MLQKSLVEIVLRLNAGRKKAIYRRKKCNMLQKSLAEMALRVNIGKKKANLEEICSICYIISCIITLISVDSLLKLILK